MYDIVVVGGGPVGLYTAKLCKDMGYKILVMEEHGSIGKPLQCSGLISRNIEVFFPNIREWGVIEREVDAAVVHSPNSSFSLKKKGAAYVIDRSKFDKKIGEMLNSEILLNCRAGSIAVKKDYVEVNSGKGKFRCEMLVGCDGPNSVVAKGLCVRPKKMLKGLIAIVERTPRCESVDLYFDKNSLKDGFFWRIPRGKSTEYGVLGKNVDFRDVEKFFGIKKYKKFAGLIPIGPVRKSFFNRILLIGDAAGQVKPWSGGGVIYGLTCANIASHVIKKAFENDDFSEKVLKEYETLWKTRIGKQIGFGMFLGQILRISNNRQLDLAFRTFRKLNFGWMDMDFIF